MTPFIDSSRKIWRHSAKRAIALPRVLWAAGVFLFAVFSLSASQSGEHRVDRVSVLERGIFQASSTGPPVGSSSLGPVTRVRDISLVQSTTTIHARKSLRFGLRYVITGAPAGAPVDIRLVTRFPKAGLLDPVSGVRHHQTEYTTQGVIGASAYREFTFDQSWEIVPGEWVFEFWQAGRNIGMQKFCVMDAESAPYEAAPLQGANCAFLIGGPKKLDVLNLHTALWFPWTRGWPMDRVGG
ncbi:MAG: DUF3859 domain-containing protein [Rhizobiales bacterium]|nr:DUF3859 domain-containing protein [Hyphomicrobiales bacterium]